MGVDCCVFVGWLAAVGVWCSLFVVLLLTIAGYARFVVYCLLYVGCG